MPLKIFVVFHERLDPRCYQDLEPEEFEALTFLAVNPDIPKRHDPAVFPNVIKEWELPVYDPTLQNLGYCENSALWHAKWNGLYAEGDHVAFLQWDMVLEKGSVKAVADSVGSAPLWSTSVGWEKMGWCFKDNVDLLAEICNAYQDRFRAPLAFNKTRYPMGNVYALPAQDLNHILDWAIGLRDAVERECKDAKAWAHFDAPWKRIGIVYEHIMAIGVGNLYDKMSWRPMTGVWHPTAHTFKDTPPHVIDLVGADFACGFK